MKRRKNIMEVEVRGRSKKGDTRQIRERGKKWRQRT
jgi:hypothetical protein